MFPFAKMEQHTLSTFASSHTPDAPPESNLLASDLPCGKVPELVDQIKQLNLVLADQRKQLVASSNKEAACTQVLEEHMQRARVEDARTVEWQKEE